MASLIRQAWPKDTEPGRILFANPSNLENEWIRPGWSAEYPLARGGGKAG